LGLRLTTPPHKKILLRDLKRRPRPTQGCRADDDDDDDDDYTEMHYYSSVGNIDIGLLSEKNIKHFTSNLVRVITMRNTFR
jgi:hypothetical protein